MGRARRSASARAADSSSGTRTVRQKGLSAIRADAVVGRLHGQRSPNAQRAHCHVQASTWIGRRNGSPTARRGSIRRSARQLDQRRSTLVNRRSPEDRGMRRFGPGCEEVIDREQDQEVSRSGPRGSSARVDWPPRDKIAPPGSILALITTGYSVMISISSGAAPTASRLHV